MIVTLYHRTGEGWEKIRVDDVWARWSYGISHQDRISRDDRGESMLLIPWRDGLALDLGDGVFPGEGPDVTAGPLKAQLPESRIITEIHCHRPGSPLDHWEVTAR